MRKITDFIINKRHFILILFVIFTIISTILLSKVKINYDIAKYLPDTSETRIGMDIMEKEFSEVETSTLNLMFKDLQDEEKTKIKSYLENIDGIKSVDYDNTEKYNKENYTLYVITVDAESDSQKSTEIYNQITEKYKDYTIYTSGDVSECNKSVLPMWIIILAVFCALIILLIMCESYVEPFLFLISILIAIILNKGTNIIFKNVSHITNSIAAILQMALSMDYSIMLMNRYNQEKETEKDNVKAMKNALYKAFQAISSSSITTIVGLLALVFMSFKIGKDLGFVLAKGVLFSLVCIFFVLPALILMFDKWIVKTKKKTPNIKLNLLGKFSYKARYVAPFVFLIVFITSFMLKGNLGIDYTDTQSNEISEIFTENNQIAIVYKNSQEEKISKYLASFESEEKVDEVLGYGNTINEKLTYDKLNEKLNDLGSDVNVEDYLLKILYYDYYNPDENNNMTFSEFINFIENEAYKNKKTNEKIDEQTKNDITRLKNFVEIPLMDKRRTSADIAKILEIDKAKIDDIFIYYLSKNNNLQIGMDEFINFMNKDVLTNEKYSKKIGDESRNKLNTLSKFISKQVVQTKMTSNQMAELFGIDINTMNELYKYYALVNDVNIKMTISEFSNFVLNTVINDSTYANSFDKATIENVKLLETFSNMSTITKKMASNELSNLFGIDENKINQILLLKYTKQNSGGKFSITEFINSVIAIENSTNYLEGVDISKLKSVSIFAQNKDNINTTQMNKDTLNQVFGSFAAELVDKIYILAQLPNEQMMTPQEFVDLVLNISEENMPISEATELTQTITEQDTQNMQQISDSENNNTQTNLPLDENTLNSLKLLKMIIDDSLSSDKVRYTAEELSQILNINVDEMYQLYALINYVSGNTSSWTCTPNEFVKLILNNKELESIKSNIDEATISKLNLLYTVMTSSIKGIEYTYQELSEIIRIDTNSVKNIYILYVSYKNSTILTPIEFVNFVLAHKEDSMLANKIPGNTINDLNLLQTVMNGIIENKKYNNNELSSLLGLDKEDVDLLYGLYTSKYISKNTTISLKEFVEFLLNNVVTNKEYANNFDDEQISKLNTVNGIMKNSLKNTKYTSNEIFGIISNLSDKVDKNTVEILYTYYGSNKEYNDSWKMTIEEFVNFLNDDILKDERFNDFIEENMRKDIVESKNTVSDAKKLLIGDTYSRIVLNTQFAQESNETFSFIQKVKDLLSKDIEDFYIIGNSPMAYEMSKTFNNELNFMTILTMISIFIVVVFTFKSVIIPIILVLVIQCAVYLTMGILAFAGENVYFISILIVQSILMGATIDYAILYTSYYLENRKINGIKESIIDSYNKSIHTILTSSSILIIVTLIIANFASAIAAKICKTISEGTLCSTILILTLLPAVLAFWDKFINKK